MGSFENGSVFTQALSQLMIDEYEFGGAAIISNRVFEVMLYNYYLSLDELKNSPISVSGSESKEMLIENGHLNMDKLLERYVAVFDDAKPTHSAKRKDAEDSCFSFVLLLMAQAIIM